MGLKKIIETLEYDKEGDTTQKDKKDNLVKHKRVFSPTATVE